MPAATAPRPAAAPCVCGRLRRAARALTQLYDDLMAPAGLRVTQFSLLRTLAARGPQRMSALAAAALLDRTALSRTLEPLAGQGLVRIATGRDARTREVALTRAGAQAGDDLWVSGTPGLAALGLNHRLGKVSLHDTAIAPCLAALDRPQPRVELGLALRGLASAAIDVSDGLLADLGHILERSALAADIEFTRLPRAALDACGDAALAQHCLLAGGDDYELAFSAPPARRKNIAALSAQLGLPLTRIGRLHAGPAGELILRDAAGQPMPVGQRGFDHFA